MEEQMVDVFDNVPHDILAREIGNLIDLYDDEYLDDPDKTRKSLLVPINYMKDLSFERVVDEENGFVEYRVETK